MNSSNASSIYWCEMVEVRQASRLQLYSLYDGVDVGSLRDS